MSSRRSKRYIQQLGLWAGLRQSLCERLMRWMDRHGSLGYGQTGEDRIIEAILPRKKDGFYVDVGCHHPTRYSNTFRLYKRGWHGIGIDANGALVEQYQRRRPSDTVICAAVSDHVGEATFLECNEAALSTLSATHAHTYIGPDSVITERQVTTQSLTSILDSSGAPGSFDLLTVDVESRDLQVIRGLDFQRYRPHLVVIEMHDFDLEDRESSPIYLHLVQQGYRLVGYAVMNGYFLREAGEANS